MDREWTIIELVMEHAKKHNVSLGIAMLKQFVAELSNVNHNCAALALLQSLRDRPALSGMPTPDEILSRATRIEREEPPELDDAFESEDEEIEKTTRPNKQNHGKKSLKIKR